MADASDDDMSATHDVDYTRTVQSLKCAFSGSLCICDECENSPSNAQISCAGDDNEIDLDCGLSDCDDDLHTAETGNENECMNKCSAEDTSSNNEITRQDIIDLASPHIILLGTGCATPSPLRGSSGYGLFVPTSFNGTPALVLSAMIECGEGTLTGLLRHLPSLYGDDYTIDSKLTSLDVQLSHVNFIWIRYVRMRFL